MVLGNARETQRPLVTRVLRDEWEFIGQYLEDGVGESVPGRGRREWGCAVEGWGKFNQVEASSGQRRLVSEQ